MSVLVACFVSIYVFGCFSLSIESLNLNADFAWIGAAWSYPRAILFFEQKKKYICSTGMSSIYKIEAYIIFVKYTFFCKKNDKRR